MAAEYDFKTNPDSLDEEGLKILHPRIVSKGTIDIEKITRDLSHRSPYTIEEIEGVTSFLLRSMVDYLKQGYEVKLGNIGYFSVKLKARPVTDKKEIRSGSIQFDNINFRASTAFKEMMGNIELVRAVFGFRASSVITQEECKELLDKFLAENHFITRREYSKLTGLLKGKALESLNQLVEEGWLAKRGSGSHLVYVRKKVAQ